MSQCNTIDRALQTLGRWGAWGVSRVPGLLVGLALASVLALHAQPLQAQTRALVLGDSTTSGSGDYFNAAIAEMQAVLGAANVASIGNLDVNNLVPADLLDGGGNKYDIIVVTAVYEGFTASNRALLQTAVQNRTANAFFLFPDQCSMCAANVDNITLPLINAATGWGITKGPIPGGPGVVNLNTNSPLHTSFTPVNPMSVNNYTTLSNVPADNVLYMRYGVALPATGTAPTNNVAALIVPRAQSFGGRGACMFVISDVNPLAIPGNPPVGRLGGSLVAAVAGSCSVNEGSIQVTKQLDLPADVTGPFTFNFSARCDLPAAGTVYGPVPLDYPTNTTVEIPFIPGGANCTLEEALPAPPADYAWATPVLDSVTVIAAQSVSAHATNRLVSTKPVPPVAVPALGVWALMVLGLLLAGLGGRRIPRQR